MTFFLMNLLIISQCLMMIKCWCMGWKQENENKTVHYRIDVLFHYIAKIIIPRTCNKKFELLHQVASHVLVLPHSNASLERLFNVVRKNKSDRRSSLKLDDTLSSILTTKNYNPESLNLCYKSRPDKYLLDSSKKTTIEQFDGYQVAQKVFLP